MRTIRRNVAAILAVCVLMPLASSMAAEADKIRPQTDVEKKAIDYLVANQEKAASGAAYDETKFPHGSGAWCAEIGPAVTAMAIRGLVQSGHTVDEPIVKKALEFVYSTQQTDGGFYTAAVPSYNTAITLSMLAVLPQTEEVKGRIAKAEKFLRSTQSTDFNNAKDNQGNPITKDHPWYGGSGYTAGNARSSVDMSNTSFFLDALIDNGAKSDDPAVQAALVFVSRNQGLSETNDQTWAKGRSDGGFIYSTAGGADGGAKSEFTEERDGKTILKEYGSMTYAGLKSFMYAGLKKDDPRVKAAYRWITGHWSLDENPATGTRNGLFYFYHTYAKALHAYGEDAITDQKGVAHDWRAELVAALQSRQRPDGSFVNDDKRWMETVPALTTSFAVLALQEARK